VPDALALLVFWAAAVLLVYLYAGYPALMWTWAALTTREETAPGTAPGEAPVVTVLVVAYNEEAVIVHRLENLLALDYPRERLEILLASDGSSDDTVRLARAYEGEGVRVIAFDQRRGKPSVLNDAVPRARGDIVVLADARQRFAPGAIRALAARFGDPRVGAVSGELILGAASRDGLGLYWRYEKLIRMIESRVDSTVGATGAIYAIRRDLFRAIPGDTILDDVLIPLRLTRRGFRVVFEPAARAFDDVASPGRDYARMVRTLAGNFQLFARERWLLDPRQNRLWVQALSHKGLRLLGPVLHAGALSGAAFAEGRLYEALFLGQVAVCAAALAAYRWPGARRRSRLLSVPYTICLLNCATVAGFSRFATGRQRATWDPTRVAAPLAPIALTEPPTRPRS